VKDKEKYLEMIAPCGYYCYGCPAYVNTTCTDEVVADNMAKRANVSIKNIRMCKGCRATNGKPHGSLCPTYDCCVNQKKLDFCYECEDFPCLKLAPISQGADVRTHNSKIYNLLMLKKLGMDAYIEKGQDWWILYARGKSPIPGDDPQI
jgi:hypothetical protein